MVYVFSFSASVKPSLIPKIFWFRYLSGKIQNAHQEPMIIFVLSSKKTDQLEIHEKS